MFPTFHWNYLILGTKKIILPFVPLLIPLWYLEGPPRLGLLKLGWGCLKVVEADWILLTRLNLFEKNPSQMVLFHEGSTNRKKYFTWFCQAKLQFSNTYTETKEKWCYERRELRVLPKQVEQNPFHLTWPDGTTIYKGDAHLTWSLQTMIRIE